MKIIKNNKEKIAIYLTALILISIFFAFGLYHLTKFETSDEYLWKHTRIPAYWSAIENKNWEKTYINDKPGVSLTLISGIGMLFKPYPESHKIIDENLTNNNLYAVYNVSKTEDVNMSLRLPILIFNTFFLFYFFWIIKRLTSSELIALFSLAFLALSAPLIGISQIINPDAFLWLFSAAAFFTYFTHIKNREKKTLFLTGIFAGFALLSKYTANILFPSFLMLIVLNYFFNFKKNNKEEFTKKYFLKNFLNLFYIFVIASAIYAILLPASLVDLKILYAGTIGFSGFKMILVPLIFFIGLVIFDIHYNKSKIIFKCTGVFSKHQKNIIRISVGVLFLAMILVMLNVWLNQSLIPFDKLQNDIYAKGKNGYHKILKEAFIGSKLLISLYPFVFSLPIALLVIVYSYWIKIIKKGEGQYSLYVVFISIFSLLYFLASALLEVLTNVRYSLMVYPLFAFLAGLGLFEFYSTLKNIKIKLLLIITVLFCLIYPLWISKPYYLSYANSLLPKKYTITDSWGYGSYEAAQYLNSLPNAKNITIWSNRKAVCQFFVGNCIRSKKIDLSKTIPEYFVITKRGELKNHFSWTKPELAKHAPSYYYEKIENNYIWHEFIGKRPENYIKIIKFEE